MPWEVIFKGMPPFLLMISVGRGQDCSRRCLLEVWTLFIHPQAFLPPRHGSWALYEVGQGCWVLWPHNTCYLFIFPSHWSFLPLLFRHFFSFFIQPKNFHFFKHLLATYSYYSFKKELLILISIFSLYHFYYYCRGPTTSLSNTCSKNKLLHKSISFTNK